MLHFILLSQNVFLDKTCLLYLPFIRGNVDSVENFHSQRVWSSGFLSSGFQVFLNFDPHGSFSAYYSPK